MKVYRLTLKPIKAPADALPDWHRRPRVAYRLYCNGQLLRSGINGNRQLVEAECDFIAGR